MMTDSSFWTNINPYVKQIQTKKKFYGKYLYKMQVYVSGSVHVARNIDHTKYNTIKQFREKIRSKINRQSKVVIEEYENGFRYRNIFGDQYIVNVDCGWPILQAKKKYYPTGDMHTTTSHPNRVHIFTTREEILREIIINLSLLGSQYSLQEITLPAVSKIDSLNNGAILTTKANDFKYRYELNTCGNYNHETKLTILSFLNSLIEVNEIEVPSFTLRSLHNNRRGRYSLFFYSNDGDIELPMNIIKPGCITHVYPINTPEYHA